ncbi:MAG: DUF1934 domain-containing protein [Clostridia bacterium]|nr:DUF1934 domain-containing protein [Clostridia bacterium]
MSASEKAKLHIRSSVKNDGGESEVISFVTEGLYEKTDGGFVILYTELTESGKVECRIITDGGKVTVKRCGAIESTLVFRGGHRHVSLYSLGGFAFDMAVSTRQVKCELGDAGGRLALHYDMTVGGADKEVRFSVRVEKA